MADRAAPGHGAKDGPAQHDRAAGPHAGATARLPRERKEGRTC